MRERLLFLPSISDTNSQIKPSQIVAGIATYHLTYFALETRILHKELPILSLQMTELEMTQFFSKYGEVKDAKIITDRDGGKSRG